MTPDATGDYLPFEIYNGKMSYRRTDGAWFLWWDGDVTWVISASPGDGAPPYWFEVSPDPPGTYEPSIFAEGTGTLVEI